MTFTVLDLFSAAAGGWSLGLHRAGFKTVGACEVIAWRRALYSENNPDVRVYDDVRTLTAKRLQADLGYVPDVVVGSPPCQDISSANTKGKGVDGARSGLFFEAVRIIGEVRPRWFALENSSNLRTRGADRVLDALAALGYACEPCVVGADNAGANHERKRSWLIGFDPDAYGDGRASGRRGRRRGFDLPAPADHHTRAEYADPSRLGYAGGRSRRHGADGDGAASVAPRDAEGNGRESGRPGRRTEPASRLSVEACGDGSEVGVGAPGDAAFPRRAQREGERCDDGSERAAAERAVGERAPDDDANAGHESERRPVEPATEGVGNCLPDGGDVGGDCGRRARGGTVSRRHDESAPGEPSQVDWGASAGGDAGEPWADWNGGLASHLRLDDGLSPWLAGARVAVGGPRGTSAASLLVEAFGDSVVPQIPEAIGRAILRTEAALAAIYGADA